MDQLTGQDDQIEFSNQIVDNEGVSALNREIVPTNLNVQQARLPQTYENAKTALVTCEKLDEVRDWGNKAEALASYAKMADDQLLFNMAIRIKARAVRRCGEMLKEIEGRGGDRSKGKGSHTSAQKTRREVAEHSGISRHQQVTAVRVAAVPEEDFEAAIEAETPATITKLADMGKSDLYRPKPDGFAKATEFLGSVRELREFCGGNRSEAIAQGMYPHEAKDALPDIAFVKRWLDGLTSELEARQ